MKLWSIYQHIVEFASRAGECVDHLIPASDKSKLSPKTLDDICHESDDARTLMLDSDAMALLDTAEMHMICAHRPTWVVQKADSVYDDYPISFRTVMASGDSFFNIEQNTGDELVADASSAHLLEEIADSTDFEYYYIMIEDYDDPSYARDFVRTRPGRQWRLTSRQFTQTTTAELERMIDE